MSEPILDPNYWSRRLHKAPADALHHAIYRCPLHQWTAIEQKHRKILAEEIKPNDSILDCGCGWGRLLTLLPDTWRGDYLGIDLSPDFIALAQQNNPTRSFMVDDLRKLDLTDTWSFDWAIFISIRPMVIRNLGDQVWTQMEANIRKYAKQLLFLEYENADNGSIE